MCKDLVHSLAVSSAVSEGNQELLESFGISSKGIRKPVEVWGVRANVLYIWNRKVNIEKNSHMR